MARGGIRLIHGLTKSTLITYYSGRKKDPKYAFLHAFFLICLSCSFQNLSIWPKTHPFFPILHVFAPLNDVRAYSAWSWKTPLITWIFGRAWYPPWHSSGPPGILPFKTCPSSCSSSVMNWANVFISSWHLFLISHNTWTRPEITSLPQLTQINPLSIQLGLESGQEKSLVAFTIFSTFLKTKSKAMSTFEKSWEK